MKVNIGPYTDRSKEERVIEVHIDDYDHWNLDHTLALIIAPALKTLRDNLHGAGSVDNEDVPEELWSLEDRELGSPPDEQWMKRWEYVLDEMIFSFEFVCKKDGDYYRDDKTIARVKNGHRLFGKYYFSLWD